MNKAIIQSVDDAARAIENLNRAFDQHAATLKSSGSQESLEKWKQACFAMRDSGNIYINWAQYYARGSASAPSSENEADFLDEGAF